MSKFNLYRIDSSGSDTFNPAYVQSYNDIIDIRTDVSSRIKNSHSKIVVLFFSKGGDTLTGFQNGYENVFRCKKCESESREVSELKCWFFDEVMGMKNTHSFSCVCEALNVNFKNEMASRLQKHLISYAKILQEIRSTLHQVGRSDIEGYLKELHSMIYNKFPQDYKFDRPVVFLFLYSYDVLNELDNNLKTFSDILHVTYNIWLIESIEDKILSLTSSEQALNPNYQIEKFSPETSIDQNGENKDESSTILGLDKKEDVNYNNSQADRNINDKIDTTDVDSSNYRDSSRSNESQNKKEEEIQIKIEDSTMTDTKKKKVSIPEIIRTHFTKKNV